MGLREDFQKRIDKKQQEIAELELKIKEARSYVQALLDTMKILPKQPSSINGTAPEFQLRPGTALAKARDAIKHAGKPLHVNELLKSVGKPIDKANKVSLSGSLAGYVRRGEIFTRPAPNTFGLLELEKPKEPEPQVEDLGEEIPETFGKL
jgi:hypothetical protein